MNAQLRTATTSANRATQTQPPRAPAIERAPPKKLLTPARLFFLVTVALLAFGYNFPTQRYLSPERGVGYLLGLIGGSAMLILLLYPLRKRFRWMSFMGSTKAWFQTHMILGVMGPLSVLYHSNFSFGATNSNVALVCMLVVSGSGLFGRYFYRRIHNGLYGTKATLAELQSHAQRTRAIASNIAFLPDLMARIEQEEAVVTARCANTPTVLRPVVATWLTLRARIRLYRHVRRSLRNAGHPKPMPAEQRQRIYRTASLYIDTRLMANKRALEFEAYERLFSLWHVLHLPLFFMLVIAGVVHVIAVHVY